MWLFVGKDILTDLVRFCCVVRLCILRIVLRQSVLDGCWSQEHALPATLRAESNQATMFSAFRVYLDPEEPTFLRMYIRKS